MAKETVIRLYINLITLRLNYIFNSQLYWKVARDREENAGIDEWGIYCKGIDELSEESILIAGRHGGGLPNTTFIGEWLTV